MTADAPVTERQLDAKIAELRAHIESRVDVKIAELRTCIEKGLNDQTRWVIGWMTVVVFGAAGLIIGLG